MHLLVLSAFRQKSRNERNGNEIVSMHLLVLSAFRPAAGVLADIADSFVSQCTFWCSVLSDYGPRQARAVPAYVSMHLLVLSAFRHNRAAVGVPSRLVSMHLLVLSAFRLGRPRRRRMTGESQCTFWCSVLSDPSRRLGRGSCLLRLNAPFGAQCFPTDCFFPREPVA